MSNTRHQQKEVRNFAQRIGGGDGDKHQWELAVLLVSRQQKSEEVEFGTGCKREHFHRSGIEEGGHRETQMAAMVWRRCRGDAKKQGCENTARSPPFSTKRCATKTPNDQTRSCVPQAHQSAAQIHRVFSHFW